jgi:hypothetical protein
VDLFFNIYYNKIKNGVSMSKEEKLKELEDLLMEAMKIDNLPAIEHYEALIASLKREDSDPV